MYRRLRRKSEDLDGFYLFTRVFQQEFWIEKMISTALSHRHLFLLLEVLSLSRHQLRREFLYSL